MRLDCKLAADFVSFDSRNRLQLLCCCFDCCAIKAASASSGKSQQKTRSLPTKLGATTKHFSRGRQQLKEPTFRKVAFSVSLLFAFASAPIKAKVRAMQLSKRRESKLEKRHTNSSAFQISSFDASSKSKKSFAESFFRLSLRAFCALFWQTSRLSFNACVRRLRRLAAIQVQKVRLKRKKKSFSSCNLKFDQIFELLSSLARQSANKERTKEQRKTLKKLQTKQDKQN